MKHIFVFAWERHFSPRQCIKEWKFVEELVEGMDFLIIQASPVFYLNILRTLPMKVKTQYFTFK
jgi:hypothetical protein